MNQSQTIGLILIVGSLALLFTDKLVPTPDGVTVNKALASDIRGVMPDGSEDAKNLGRCLLSAANLFALDSQRDEPYYKDVENMKWAIKNVGDLSYPLGWKMSEKYPALPGKLGGWLDSQLGKDFTNAQLVEKMRELGYALMAV